MTADESDAAGTLSRARQRCTALLDDLRRDAAALRTPSPHVGADALAEGAAACDRAALAAEELLRRLNEPTDAPQ